MNWRVCIVPTILYLFENEEDLFLEIPEKVAKIYIENRYTDLFEEVDDDNEDNGDESKN